MSVHQPPLAAPPALTQPRRSGSRWVTVAIGGLGIAIGVAAGFVVIQLGLVTAAALPVAGLFLAILAQPGFGVATLVFITYTQLSNVLIEFHGLPSIAQPLNVLLMAIIFLRVALYGERPRGWLKPALLLGLYALPGVLSFFYAADRVAVQARLFDYLKDILSALILVVLVQRPKSLRAVAWALILTSLLMGAIGSYQGLTRTWSEPYWGFGSIDRLVEGEATTNRLTGPFADPNVFAYSLVVIIPLALDRMIYERRYALRLVALVALGASVLSIVFTYSRGGFLALMLTLVLLVVRRRPRIGPLLVSGLLLVGLVSIIPRDYISRIDTLTRFLPFQDSSARTQLYDPSFRGRTSENTAGWMMFADNPLLGVGLANYPTHYLRYSALIGLDPRREARTPASLYMEILSEQGLLGAGLFAVVLWYTLRSIWRAPGRLAAVGERDASRLAQALAISVAVLVFSSLFRNSAYSNSFWLLIGLGLAAGQVAKLTWQDHRANGLAEAGPE